MRGCAINLLNARRKFRGTLEVTTREFVGFSSASRSTQFASTNSPRTSRYYSIFALKVFCNFRNCLEGCKIILKTSLRYIRLPRIIHLLFFWEPQIFVKLDIFSSYSTIFNSFLTAWGLKLKFCCLKIVDATLCLYSFTVYILLPFLCIIVFKLSKYVTTVTHEVRIAGKSIGVAEKNERYFDRFEYRLSMPSFSSVWKLLIRN